ncbi:nuclease SbcCD subunit C [Sulfurovum sp. TSL6]|uniref:SbcC/MukB-like Walker B domain-containing protein n=1 Tax=Sulfurovum sp. TSL6 TaxID=2826995 RepID=UPI001CC36AFF|nr:AAA family ATPase [Sulfurovum sp. TSL6]GIT99716.1 nuclease SbcCD subunit C [Sulfurovum sp. TSL6]
MKILRLKSKNINSLKGDISIDFYELLKDNALFAITGPTGSGKSTLLDVITCALYGQTPRLKNPSDLMSRHSGEAFCEVEFEVKGKVYRSSWRQKRARNKHDGKLQPASMELSDVKAEEVIETKVSRVPKFIEELTGLDFDRFTQSMMLAQGSFDAFLKAKEGERSALLEKITGTKIYADISKRVYEKYSEGKQAIEIDDKLLENIEFMNEEVLKAKTETLAQNKKQKLEDDKHLKELNLALHWTDTLSKLILESEKYHQGFIEISKEKEDKKEDFIKLDLANKALNVSSLYTQKSGLEKIVQTDSTSLEVLDKELKILAADIVISSELCEQTKMQSTQAKSTFDSEVQKLKLAREIQTQEQENQKATTEIQKTIESKTASEKFLKESLEKVNENFKNLSIEIEAKNNYLQTNIKDEKLISSMSLIEENLKKFTQEETRLTLLLNDKAKVDARLKQTQESEKSFQAELETLSLTSKNSETAYVDIEKKTSADVTVEPRLQAELKQIETLLYELKIYHELLKKKEQEQLGITLNSEKEKSLTESVKSATENIKELKAHIETLRIKKEQELKIKAYEADRANLVEGEACFLCGSREHPFAEHSEAISTDETTSLIKEKESQLLLKETELRSHESARSSIKNKIETSTLEIAKLDRSIATITEIFKNSSFEITSKSKANLKEKQTSIEESLREIVKRRQEKETLLKQRDAAALALRTKENELSAIKTETVKRLEQLKQFHVNEKASIVVIENLTKELTTQWKEYGLVFDKERVSLQIKDLLDKRDAYLACKTSLETLEKELAGCGISKVENETKIASLTAELSIDNKKLNDLAVDLTALIEKRISILNIVNLDAHDKEIHETFKMIESKVQAATQKLQELTTKKSEKEIQTKALSSKITKDKETLDALAKDFTVQLKANGFDTIEELNQASMENEARQALELSCKTINDKFNEIKTLQEETVKRLEEHKKTPQSDKPIELLKEEQELCQKKVDDLQLSIGRDEKELELNRENETKHKDKIASLEKKKEAFKVWAKMQELIGSADGKKFAKFAQGITLDQLISLANQHLNILSQRYTLVRSQEEKQLLEIEVIDAFQGNVMRPVSTLSGGESFIVSLALALGLSELASQKISIDSLFLDEGFGSLDEESLETALNALNLLQSSGKMVGVISHVEALKERIPLQIKVVPKGDGTSFVEIGGIL